MACKGLRLYALANHIIATHAAQEDSDAAAAAAALFAVTAKSLGGGGVQVNARDQLLRHHYSAMDHLREVSNRLKAGEALPGDPPPSYVIQQATRLKELSQELRQFSSKGLATITSPRTAHQICRIFRLGDGAFEEWQAQQPGRGRKASVSKGRRRHTPSPKRSGKRKTPEKQPRSASRLAPDSSPVATAAAAEAQGVPQPEAQRRRSCEEEEEEQGGLMPKQLFVGGGEGSADSVPAAPGQQGSQQDQQQPQQVCEEWAAFKAFVSSPRKGPASGGGTRAPAAATPQAAERLPQPEQQPQRGLQQPMDVESQQGSLEAAAAAPVGVQPQVSSPSLAAGGAAGSSPATAPLSPKQGALSGRPADLTPEKVLLAPGLYSSPVDKENGCGPGSWVWDSSPEGPEAWAASAAAAAPSSRGQLPAAVRRGLLVLQSPATERAAAAREQMAAEAAEVLAADVLRLLSESDLMLSLNDSQAAGGSASCSGCCSADLAGMDTAISSGSSGSGGSHCSEGAAEETASSAPAESSAIPGTSPAGTGCSSSGTSSPDAMPVEISVHRQLRMPPRSAAAPPRRTLVICSSNRLFEFDAAASKAAAAAPEVHAGGSLEVWMTRHNLNAAGRAHSIMRPIALPAVI